MLGPRLCERKFRRIQRRALSLRVALISPCAVAPSARRHARGDHRGHSLWQTARVFIRQVWELSFQQPDVFCQHTAKRRTHGSAPCRVKRWRDRAEFIPRDVKLKPAV